MGTFFDSQCQPRGGHADAIENVLLSRHGLVWRSPQRKEPGGRWELRRTAPVVRPTENSRCCTDSGSGAIFLPEQFRAIAGRSEQTSIDGLVRLTHEGVPAGVAGATTNKLRCRSMVVISPPRFFLRFLLRFFLREGQDSRLAVLMLSRPVQKKKTEGLQYQSATFPRATRGTSPIANTPQRGQAGGASAFPKNCACFGSAVSWSGNIP